MAKQNQGDFAVFFLNKCLDVNIKRLYNYNQVEGLARDAKRRKTMNQEHTKQIARILADEAGFEICELFGKPEVCIPSDSADYGILDHLTRFYDLVREQTIKEIN